MIPMNVYYTMVTYDSNLFKKFMQLAKGLRKHLLFYVFEEMAGVSDAFMKKYDQVF